MVKLLVGMPETRKLHDWNAFAVYTSGNQLRTGCLHGFRFPSGGTNTKGWLVGANYGLDKNTWLTLRWFSADAIDGPAFSRCVAD